MASPRIAEYEAGIWDITRSTQIVEVAVKDEAGNDTEIDFDPYKLHISIDPELFLEEHDFNPAIKNKIDAILRDAVDKLVIRGFKIFNLARLGQRMDEIEKELGHLPEDWQAGALRMMQLPYTIYLHHDFNGKNANDILELCLKIEAVLKDVPPAILNLEASSDLKVTPHIMFRMTTTEPKTPRYIQATDAKHTPFLRHRGLEAEYYQFLSEGLSPKAATAANTGAAAAAVNLSSHVAAGNSPVSVKKAVDAASVDPDSAMRDDASPATKKK